MATATANEHERLEDEHEWVEDDEPVEDDAHVQTLAAASPSPLGSQLPPSEDQQHVRMNEDQHGSTCEKGKHSKLDDQHPVRTVMTSTVRGGVKTSTELGLPGDTTMTLVGCEQWQRDEHGGGEKTQAVTGRPRWQHDVQDSAKMSRTTTRRAGTDETTVARRARSRQCERGGNLRGVVTQAQRQVGSAQ
ncbi:hypothetical protein NLJ89_g11517 [Agrocybe chaxingu]|uniref:Uncharacterized protein n=1 Tax=Agrocybe chaxingu TaxID=84603 RepID=A0A9W8JPT4_9AGAR|nr:hypothetical protein NLJ89_g11517 [Agrocybe chaxingu]